MLMDPSPKQQEISIIQSINCNRKYLSLFCAFVWSSIHIFRVYLYLKNIFRILWQYQFTALNPDVPKEHKCWLWKLCMKVSSFPFSRRHSSSLFKVKFKTRNPNKSMVEVIQNIFNRLRVKLYLCMKLCKCG